MRRAVARGRLFPQSYSTDHRIGQLSLKACALFPLMWANGDDQGRLCGDPNEVKYAVCPNIEHITKADIPELLKELEQSNLIKVYNTPKSKAIQLLDWWDVQRPQWAYPSQYSPPEGWKDRLRYHPRPDQIVTENWIPPSQFDKELPSALPSATEAETTLPSALPSKLGKPSLQTSHPKELKTKDQRPKRRGRGNLPSALGSKPTPTATGPPDLEIRILHRLTECFKKEWGRVPADRPYEVIPREPDPRESAQLRDLAKEISSAGGCPLEHIDHAFRDAAGRPDKMHVAYVRAILLDWMGIERIKAP